MAFYISKQPHVLYMPLYASDLKLDNVLIDGDGHCTVADFGLSKLGVFNGCKIKDFGGTPRYMAPEVIITLF